MKETKNGPPPEKKNIYWYTGDLIDGCQRHPGLQRDPQGRKDHDSNSSQNKTVTACLVGRV